MPRRCVPPSRDARPFTVTVAVLAALVTAYLLLADACQPDPARHVPDGSCRDRVVYQSARLSDC